MIAVSILHRYPCTIRYQLASFSANQLVNKSLFWMPHAGALLDLLTL